VLLWLLVVLSLLISAALLGAALFVPAPPAVAPIVGLVCLGCPLFAGLQLPAAVNTLRTAGWTARFHRHLAQLPEVEHPLGH
jgi:hypothetical protein